MPPTHRPFAAGITPTPIRGRETFDLSAERRAVVIGNGTVADGLAGCGR